ncbi:Rieske (2Fe-2S) protein [Antrihabitans sp. YC2-6]|uniref:Rieske (2Fe-2S) protein n=1 Tax=Antrihabitans sp. YC2-6 TaxID=2799498 RepID=UPI001F29D9F8|nr:Rieske (2Fe-2S) protein [Antrihabitans sp. YC2-6]
MHNDDKHSESMNISRRTAIGAVVAGTAAVAAGSALLGNAVASASPGSGAGPGVTPVRATISAANVPVGGGTVLGDVVVTQPSSGDFRGFSSVCPHFGCAVSDVSGGTINCPCHGSKFGLDGSVLVGPATAPLAPRSVTVEGDSVIVD